MAIFLLLGWGLAIMARHTSFKVDVYHVPLILQGFLGATTDPAGPFIIMMSSTMMSLPMFRIWRKMTKTMAKKAAVTEPWEKKTQLGGYCFCLLEISVFFEFQALFPPDKLDFFTSFSQNKNMMK